MKRYGRLLGTTLGVCILCFCACSGDDDSSEQGAGSGGADSADGGGRGGSGGSIAGLDEGEDCVEDIVAGETVPLDIYIMFDQSGSMLAEVENGETLIDLVREATASFLSDPASVGIGAGIGYFGYMPIGETSCDPADYATPDVPIDLLPDNAGAVVDSLDSVTPTGETPTGAAIRGACDYAQGYREAHPDHIVVILLVTDGEPKAPLSSEKGCEPTLADAAEAAVECSAGDAPIPVYVLGVGDALENLDQIAEAGDTGSAYLVEESSNVSEKVLRAMNDIRGDALIPCEFLIPEPAEGEMLDYARVNAIFTDPEGAEQVIGNVQGEGDCDPQTGGWYYDDPEAPTRIILCGTTCEQVTGEGGRFEIALGCATQIG